jgi:ATP-dependent Clp protease ATP-binding subunit ClpC
MLKQTFRPEFINRIDQVIVFRRLGKNELYRIVDLLLARVCARLQEQGITMFVTDQLCDFLLRTGYDEEYGARPLRRAIQDHVDDLLANAILNGEIAPGQTIVVTLQHDIPTIEVQDTAIIELRDISRSA